MSDQTIKNLMDRCEQKCGFTLPAIYSRFFTRAVDTNIIDTFIYNNRALRRSVKGHKGFGSIGSSLNTGFQVYLFKCWVLVCESRLYDTTCFLLCSFFLVLAS